MDVNRLKLLIVTLVAMLSLALGASSALAHHDKGHWDRDGQPQKKCEDTLTDQFDRKNKLAQPSTNCDHLRP
jgi:hypothetical protein